MDTRRTGLSLLITIGIMLALGVVGAVHRGGPSQQPGLRGASLGSGETPAGASSREPVANPLHPPPVAEWDVLTACELAENKTDASHHFHIRRADDIYVFQLYYANAPEVATARPEHTAEQVRYFGIATQAHEDEWDKVLADLGEIAWQYTQEILRARPFLIFTKWEKRPDTHHYYAFVYVEDNNGQKRFLQELLVEKGYALITEPTLKNLPDQTSGADFVERLQNLQRQAQQKHVGGWSALRLAR